MNKVDKIVQKADAFSTEAHKLFAKFEGNRSNVYNLGKTREDIEKTSDVNQKAYLTEAFKSIEGGFYRGAIVLAWCAMMDFIYDCVMQKEDKFSDIKKGSL